MLGRGPDRVGEEELVEQLLLEVDTVETVLAEVVEQPSLAEVADHRSQRRRAPLEQRPHRHVALRLRCHPVHPRTVANATGSPVAKVACGDQTEATDRSQPARPHRSGEPPTTV